MYAVLSEKRRQKKKKTKNETSKPQKILGQFVS